MGCIVIFGLFLIGAGISQGKDGIYGVASGLMLIWFVWSMRGGKSHRIDSSVRNKIVAQDGNGRYLVQADTSRQITGPRPHVSGNLPAAVVQVGDGWWVVDSVGYKPDGYDFSQWMPVEGNVSIEPRGNTETGGFLSDVMEGYDHNYIVREDE